MRRVGLVLCSGVANAIPSTRIAILNVLPFLRGAGFHVSVLYEPPWPNEWPDLAGVAQRALETGCEVVVLQKVRGPSAVALARQLSSAGIRTIYMVCDLVEVAMVEVTNATITVTEYLKSLYPQRLHSRIHVVHDGIERPEVFKSEWNVMPTRSGTRLGAVLVTSAALDYLPVIGRPPSWLDVRIVGSYGLGFQKWRATYWRWKIKRAEERLPYLRFLLSSRIGRVQWHPDAVYREMVLADIGIIPIETPPEVPDSDPSHSWKNKSENRLTMKMSIGLPVIATPIPSYEAVIEHGVNGFFARTARDWTNCLEALRDPERRRVMGMAARATVIHRYSMQQQAMRFIAVLRDAKV